MKARLTIYWKPHERDQLQEILKQLGISPYRYVKDCVQYLTAVIQAVHNEDISQIWNTFFEIVQTYGNFELNLNSIFAALRDAASVDLAIKTPLDPSTIHTPNKKHTIPLLRPEQQRTVELAGTALGFELKDAFKAFKVLVAASDSDEGQV